MSKTIKTLATLLGISVFCLISPMSMLAQTKIQSPDFEDPPEAPISTQLTDPNEPPISTTEPTDSNVTVSCVNDDSTNNIPTTIVEKGTKDTPDYQRAVLISWKTRELGGNFTPKQRCNGVRPQYNTVIRQQQETHTD